MTDERTQQPHDYRARSGVVTAFLVLPADAPALDRAALWNGAERAESRRNGRLATELELALPHELPAQERRALVEEFARDIGARHGVAVDVAIHRPGRGGDHRNHHAHLLVTHRHFAAAGFGGLAKAFDSPAKVREVRRDWEAAVNHAYERAGLDLRVDHRSHKDRGIPMEPTQHLGPKASGIERRGESSERGDINRAIRADNAALSARPAAAHIAAPAAALTAQQEEQPAMEQGEAARAAAAQSAAHDAEQRRQNDARIAALSAEHQAAELAALEARRLEEIEAVRQRAAAYLAEREKERQAEAERLAKAEQERAKQSEAQRGDNLPIRDAGARYAQALGAHYDVANPYQSLARAALAEHGAFVRDQEALRMEAANARDPAKRELLELRRQVESAEHLAQSGQRVARINETLTGKRDDHWREFAAERSAEAVSLREQYRERTVAQARERATKEPEAAKPRKPAAEPARGFGGREQRKTLLRQQREQEQGRGRGKGQEHER